MLHNFIKKFLFILFICVINKFNICNAQCTFESFDHEKPPLFLNRYDENSYNLLQHLGETVPVLEGAELLGYCPTGLSLLDVKNKELIQFKLTCVDNKLIIEVGNETFQDESTLNTKISCVGYGKIKLLEKLDTEGCNQRNYAVTTKGPKPNDVIVVLAECCFNLHRMKFTHLHFTARSSGLAYLTNVKKFVDEQDGQNFQDDHEFEHNADSNAMDDSVNGVHISIHDPNSDESEDNTDGKKKKRQILLMGPKEIKPNEHTFLKVTIPLSVFFFSKEDLDELLPNLMPHKHFVYLISDLFPKEAFYPYFKNPFKDVSNIQKFVGWRNLVLGNWKIFNKLLAEHSGEEGSYEVYMGVSHIILAPFIEEQCLKKILVKKGEKRLRVPKFLWAYVIADEGEEEFVVIGINTPYYEYNESEKNFPCKDMCSEIPWLKPLQTGRLVYNFGYIFCCHPAQVSSFLEGFPKVRTKHHFVFE